MRYLVICALLAALAVPAYAGETAPADFAYGIYMELAGDYPVYETGLPVDVYRTLTSADLGDLCVFNSQGEVVPFMLKRPAPQSEAEAGRVQAPLFPIMGDPNKGIGSLSMQVKRDDKGAIINVTTSDAVKKSGLVVVAYLVDASDVNEQVTRLSLDTGVMPPGGMDRLSVEYSEDLQNWYALVNGATVAELNYGGRTLSIKDIELGGIKARYYRITPYGGDAMIMLNGVGLVLAKKSIEPQRSWTSVEGKQAPDKPGEYTFDSAGMMPVDSIRVGLPQKNTLVAAEFLSRPNDKSAWMLRASAMVYNLQSDGLELKNPDIRFGATSDRYWMMRVLPGSGGLGSGFPKMELGWVPHRLVFVARGAAPFTLAFGSGRAFPNRGGGGYLIARVEELNTGDTPVMQAGLGEKITLGGEDAFSAVPPPINLKKLVLWAILLIGVALLAFMSIRLYRQMSQSGGGSSAP